MKIEDVADVAVSFILEEWGHLDQSQKSLYRDDRKENYGSMTSMGKNDFICVVQDIFILLSIKSISSMSSKSMHVMFIYLNFMSDIVGQQCRVSFRRTAQWVLYVYACNCYDFGYFVFL